MFRRRRGKRDGERDEVEEFVDGLDGEGDTTTLGPDTPEPGDGVPNGPWDADTAPDDDVARVDLGAVRVPTLPDVEVRVEADPSGAVSAVLLVHAGSGLQLGAFAAPRSEGIWDEVREEIATGIRDEGGTTEERDGVHGPELWGRVKTPDGVQPLRFVGVDGPRWFLRAVYTGAAATDVDAAPVLAESLRQVVVARGHDPLPVRDPLPVHLPRDVVEQQAEAEQRRVTPPARGPETTEVR